MGRRKKPEEWHKNLDRWTRSLPNDCKKVALLAAKAMADEAKRRAPVDSGKLRDSIYPLKPTSKKSVVKTGVLVTAWYAHFIEYGTSKMPPKPFLRPAMVAHVPLLEKLLGDAVRHGAKVAEVGS